LNLLTDIITYVRRIIKSPSNFQITDALLIDYINRFWLMDVDARIQLFDLKTKYQFQTTPGIDKYNMPLYNAQQETTSPSQTIALFPVYQGFMPPARVNGINVPFHIERSTFFNVWPNYVQQLIQVGTGNGTSGPYTFNLSSFPIIPGHVDMVGIINTNTNADPIYGNTLTAVPTTSVESAVYFTATSAIGRNIIIADSGQFLQNGADSDLYGLLMIPGNAPFGNTAPPNGYVNSLAITGISQAAQAVVSFGVAHTFVVFTVTAIGATDITINVDSTSFNAWISGGFVSSLSNVINYNTGVASNVTFNNAIPNGSPINAQYFFIAQGMPRTMLFHNNTITLRSPPDKQYLVEIDAYLTPAAFLSTTSAIPFGYMAEYIARGAARKILADTGDVEQFQFYEPLFREQEMLVWKRSQRQFTSTRVETIYSNRGFGLNTNQGLTGY
jgi:hypothetical protein